MSKPTKVQRAEIEEKKTLLRKWYPEGSTVHTVIRSVSKSGMSRTIGVLKLYAEDDGRIDAYHPNHAVATVLGWRVARGAVDGVKVQGCGMDMGFHLVDCLSYALYGKSGALTHRWL